MEQTYLLMVEDEQDDITLTLRTFKANGYTTPVEVVQDGQSALDHLLDEDCPLPKAVLLDLALPLRTGHEVLKELREAPRTRDLPVMVMVSSQGEWDLYTALFAPLGRVVCLKKPLAFFKFEDALANLGN